MLIKMEIFFFVSRIQCRLNRAKGKYNINAALQTSIVTCLMADKVWIPVSYLYLGANAYNYFATVVCLSIINAY